MNKLLHDKIVKRLKLRDVYYEIKGEAIHVDMDMEGVLGTIHLVTHTELNSMTTVAYWRGRVPEQYRAMVGEYLHRANIGLLRGNFEFDYDTGEVDYKLTIDVFDATNVPNKAIDMNIMIPCLMFERYGEGIIRLSLGEGTPMNMLDKAEMQAF